MPITIARVLSNVLAIFLIVVGFAHLGMLYVLIRPSDLTNLAPPIICPGLITAGAGIIARKRRAYYLAYVVIAFNLLLVLQSQRYMENLYDYYLHVPFIFPLINAVGQRFASWQQILIVHLGVALPLVASHVTLDRAGVLESPLPKPYVRRLARAGLIASSLVLAAPLMFVAIVAFADPPGNSPATSPGGYILISTVLVLWPFIGAAFFGLIACTWLLRTIAAKSEITSIDGTQIGAP